jgi:hypothetical protein
MNFLKKLSVLLLSLQASLALALSNTSNSNNGIILDGLNFALAQNISIGPTDNQISIPAVYTNIFTSPYSTVPANWMINCSQDQYASCTSTFTKDLRNSTGNNITYLLLDFPSIDTDSSITQASSLSTCPVSNGFPGKFFPQEFNYVAPFIIYSQVLGSNINVCIDGRKITQAFAANGHKVIPMISGNGGELVNSDAKDSGYLKTLAQLIAIEINNDPNASGVAFDLEPSIKGLSQNQDFYGTLSAALSASHKIIMIYDGEWQSITQLSNTNNIIAMGAMYDFGLEDTPSENHWFQAISPASYGVQFSNELTAFLNGYASKLNKIIIVPSAASDTIWTGLDVLHNTDPDPLNPTTGAPVNYDPYLVKPFDSNTQRGDPDNQPSAYVNANPVLDLSEGVPASCPTWPDVQANTANCYSTPYPSQGANDQNSYIKQTLSSKTLSALQDGSLQGVIFYNIKPDNFYELNCDNVSHQNTLCLSFQPESTPPSVIQDLNTFESSLHQSTP